MALHLIRGRRMSTTVRCVGQRRFPLAITGRGSLPPLLFDARNLSQELVATDKRPVELTHILRQVYRRFLPIAQRRQTFLFLQLFPQPFVIEGKPIVLDWVFSTFVDYALNETPAHGEVSLSAMVCADGNVNITVASACMTPILSGSFVPGSEGRSPHTTNKFWNGERTGITTANMLIEAHGGCISVDSNQYHGTDVVVILPPSTRVQEKERGV